MVLVPLTSLKVILLHTPHAYSIAQVEGDHCQLHQRT